MIDDTSAKLTRNAIFLVLVASLGYFVDIYDLLIFLIVRKASLLDLGVKPTEVFNTGISILNWQKCTP
jgi:putative MFS transporter